MTFESTSSHNSLDVVECGSTEVDVRDAPGMPLEYGETFPANYTLLKWKIYQHEYSHGTAAFSFTAVTAPGAGRATTCFGLSAGLELGADIEATDTGGRPWGF